MDEEEFDAEVLRLARRGLLLSYVARKANGARARVLELRAVLDHVEEQAFEWEALLDRALEAKVDLEHLVAPALAKKLDDIRMNAFYRFLGEDYLEFLRTWKKVEDELEGVVLSSVALVVSRQKKFPVSAKPEERTDE